MVTASQVTAFAALTLLMVAVPGPSVLFTIGRALTVGRTAALLTVAGNALGIYLQVVGVAFGLGAVLAGSATVFTVVKLAGAGYLVYLGVRAVRDRGALRSTFDTAVPVAPARAARSLAEGVVVGACNPKSVVFLAAVIPSSSTTPRAR